MPNSNLEICNLHYLLKKLFLVQKVIKKCIFENSISNFLFSSQSKKIIFYIGTLFILVNCSENKNKTSEVPFQVRVLKLQSNEKVNYKLSTDPQYEIKTQLESSPTLTLSDLIYLDKNKNGNFKFETEPQSQFRIQSTSVCRAFQDSKEILSESERNTYTNHQVQVHALLPSRVLLNPQYSWNCDLELLISYFGKSFTINFKNKNLEWDELSKSSLLYKNLTEPELTQSYTEVLFKSTLLKPSALNQKYELVCTSFTNQIFTSENAVNYLSDLAYKKIDFKIAEHSLDPRTHTPKQKCRIRQKDIFGSKMSDLFELNYKSLKPQLNCDFNGQSIRSREIIKMGHIRITNPYDFEISYAFLKNHWNVLFKSIIITGSGSREGDGINKDIKTFSDSVNLEVQHPSKIDTPQAILLKVSPGETISLYLNVDYRKYSGNFSVNIVGLNNICSSFWVIGQPSEIKTDTQIELYSDPN